MKTIDAINEIASFNENAEELLEFSGKVDLRGWNFEPDYLTYFTDMPRIHPVHAW